MKHSHTRQGITQGSTGPINAAQVAVPWWALPSAPANYVLITATSTKPDAWARKAKRQEPSAPCLVEKEPPPWWQLPSALANYVCVAARLKEAAENSITTSMCKAKKQEPLPWWALPSIRANYVALVEVSKKSPRKTGGPTAAPRPA